MTFRLPRRTSSLVTSAAGSISTRLSRVGRSRSESSSIETSAPE
jgi:hypothetical protein